MKVEWSRDALADLDRFAAFLHDKHPALAPRVAQEIKAKAQIFWPSIRNPDVRSRVVRNIARSCWRYSMRAMSFSIATTANGW
jgi:plasmid stabilization system protein ParE